MSPADEQRLLAAMHALVSVVDLRGPVDVQDRKEFWALIWIARDLLRQHPEAIAP